MISTLMKIKDKYIKNFSLCRAYRVCPVSISVLSVTYTVMERVIP